MSSEVESSPAPLLLKSEPAKVASSQGSSKKHNKSKKKSGKKSKSNSSKHHHHHHNNDNNNHNNNENRNSNTPSSGPPESERFIDDDIENRAASALPPQPPPPPPLPLPPPQRETVVNGFQAPPPEPVPFDTQMNAMSSLVEADQAPAPVEPSQLSIHSRSSRLSAKNFIQDRSLSRSARSRSPSRYIPRKCSIEDLVESTAEDFNPEEEAPLNDDVYSMFFLSNIGGEAFYYAAYIFSLKMLLFSFIAIDLFQKPKPVETPPLVLATQFFLLPVAVAIQEDLIATYYLIANVKWSQRLQDKWPGARKWKFFVACAFRGVDGAYSLMINFVVLLQATEVIAVFLNFAALQFLQTIDNVALHMAATGYLTERLEKVAYGVTHESLPKKHNEIYTSLDTVLFLSTLIGLLVGWFCYSFV